MEWNKKKAVATDCNLIWFTLATNWYKLWFDKEKKDKTQILNKEWEAISNIPLAHYTTITFF